MPKKLPLFLFSVMLSIPLTSLAAGDGAIAIGSAGLNGRVWSYMEISLNSTVERRMVRQMSFYHTVENVVTLGNINMLGYTSLDNNGNIVLQQWTRIDEQALEADFLLDSDGLSDMIENAKATAVFRYYYFYCDTRQSFPSVIVVTDLDGKPFEYGTVDVYDEQYYRVKRYTIDCEELFTNNYVYDNDGRLIYTTRETGGNTDWMQIYRYRRDGKNLLSSVSTDGSGYATSRMLYNRRSLLKTTEIYSSADGPVDQPYTYKYRYRGRGDNYTSIMRPHRGLHPYYSYSFSRTENQRVVEQKMITGAGGKKLKNPKEATRYTMRFAYNSHGDYISIRDDMEGTGNVDVTYIYDERDNWYLRTSVGRHWTATSLRSFIYTE